MRSKLTLLLGLSLAFSPLLAGGCSHDTYVPSPFQALRLEEDVKAKVSFMVAGADGKPVKVVSTQTLRAGGYYKMLVPTSQPAK